MKRIYGDTKTHLVLTEAAEAFYSSADPISIEEVETDNGFLYNISGIMERSRLTADEVSEALEDLGKALEEVE